MWKYVTRRFRDTFERNVKDVRRTWTCSEKDRDQENGIVEYRKCPFGRRHKSSDNGAGSERADSNEKFHESVGASSFHNTWLGAATWSSVLVLGWYTSQFVCFHRKVLGWDGKTPCSKLFLRETRNFHTSILSHVAWAKPIESPKKHFDPFECDFGFQNNYKVQEVSVDVVDSFEPIATDKAISIDEATAVVNSVVGDIENRLGTSSLLAGNTKTGLSHLLSGAQHKHAAATFNLGVCYELGMGVAKDYKLALECYKSAADLGHAKAMYNLGIFYVKGRGGLTKDLNEARKLFISAAKLGQKDAMHALLIDPDITISIPKFPTSMSVISNIRHAIA